MTIVGTATGVRAYGPGVLRAYRVVRIHGLREGMSPGDREALTAELQKRADGAKRIEICASDSDESTLRFAVEVLTSYGHRVDIARLAGGSPADAQ